jgi:hypothetical protein
MVVRLGYLNPLETYSSICPVEKSRFRMMKTPKQGSYSANKIAFALKNRQKAPVLWKKSASGIITPETIKCHSYE